MANKRDLERAIFEIFLEAVPEITVQLSSFKQPDDDPPDILCSMADGQRVGFELKQWLDEDQMRNAKGRERIEESILQSVGEQPPNDNQHVARVWLFPKLKIGVKPTEQEAFREELFGLIREIDERWPHEPMWHSPQGHRYDELTEYPTLTKYLHNVQFYPLEFDRGWEGSTRWIRFPYRGGHYSEKTMVNALLETIAESVEYYRGTRLGYEFDLLIHLSQAYQYNTPVETLKFSYDDAAQLASEFIGDDTGSFNNIYLLIAVEQPRVYRLVTTL
jgi:hypothetical protein